MHELFLLNFFLTLHLETIPFKNGNGKKKMNEKRTSFVIHTYCIKKFSDSLRFKNHEVQSTQHFIIRKNENSEVHFICSIFKIHDYECL